MLFTGYKFSFEPVFILDEIILKYNSNAVTPPPNRAEYTLQSHIYPKLNPLPIQAGGLFAFSSVTDHLDLNVT